MQRTHERNEWVPLSGGSGELDTNSAQVSAGKGYALLDCVSICGRFLDPTAYTAERHRRQS